MPWGRGETRFVFVHGCVGDRQHALLLSIRPCGVGGGGGRTHLLLALVI